MPYTFAATSDLVAVAWIKGIAGVPAGMVATTLPKDADTWVDGFVVVQTVGGDMNAVGVRRPVVQCSCYVAKTAASKAPRGKANVLADLLVAATLGNDGHGHVRRRVLPGGGFYPARVDDVTAITLPRWIEGEADGVARFDVELALRWVPLPA